MERHVAGRPGVERNVSRARNHNVIRDRSGIVLSDYVEDMPHKPLSALRDQLAKMQDSGQYDNPRIDFLAYTDPYPKEVDGEVTTVRHGVDDGVTHVTTSGRVI